MEGYFDSIPDSMYVVTFLLLGEAPIIDFTPMGKTPYTPHPLLFSRILTV